MRAPRSLLLVSPELGVAADGTYRPGGVQLFSRLVARALATSPRLSRLTVWGLLDDDVAMTRTLAPYLAAARARGLAIDVRGFGGSRRKMALAWLAARWRYHHAHFLHLGVARLAALTPLHRHSLWVVGIETRKRLDALERWVVRRAQPLLSISTFSSDETLRHNPDLPAATTVHLAVEPDAFWGAAAADDTPPAYVAAERPPTALIVARLAASERYKGHDELIAAWPTVVAAVPEATLLVVGAGDDAERLAALAAALPEPARARVKMLGRVPHAELLHLYRTARVFVMPSTGEGFGLVFTEAMRYGLPCIASRDSAAEIVLDGETGLVVDKAPAPIARAVITLLQDDTLAERFAAAGRRRYEDTFVFDRFRDRYLAAMDLL